MRYQGSLDRWEDKQDKVWELCASVWRVEEQEEVLVLSKIKRALEISSALVYNLLRKVVGIEVSDCPQFENYWEIASFTLDGWGCYFFLLWRLSK